MRLLEDGIVIGLGFVGASLEDVIIGTATASAIGRSLEKEVAVASSAMGKFTLFWWVAGGAGGAVGCGAGGCVVVSC